MLLIVGLGNPGKEYEKTNHNIGFRVLDRVVSEVGSHFEKKTVCNSQIAIYGVGENKVIFAKPLTYMNNSGIAVKELVKKYNINTKTSLVVVADDFDTQEGTIRIRTKSGNTTHNGIKSIKQELQTAEFIRVKVSIAPRPEFMNIADFVLSKTVGDGAKKSEEIASLAVTDLANGEPIDKVSLKYSK